MSQSLLGRAAAAALTTALAVSILSPSATQAATDAPGYQQPAVGECRNLELAQVHAPSDTSAPTDCAESHTARVIRVGRLPQGVTWTSPAEKLVSVAVRICEPAYARALGRTSKLRDRSAYGWVYFSPTKAQQAHGAKWLRCDLVLFGATKLVNLPTDSEPALDTVPLPDSVARCLTGTRFDTTTCTRRHAWRATGAFTLGQAEYPTPRQQLAVVSRRCPALVSSDRWRWSSRGELSWRQGDHTFVCYTQTHG